MHTARCVQAAIYPVQLSEIDRSGVTPDSLRGQGQSSGRQEAQRRRQNLTPPREVVSSERQAEAAISAVRTPLSIVSTSPTARPPQS